MNMNLCRSAAAIAAGALAAFGTAAFAQEASMTKVSNSTYSYFSFGYSSMIVIGDDAVLVVDPSFEPRGSQMRAAVEEITDKPIQYVLLSHEHYDHSGGTEAYPDAQVICHSTCGKIMEISPLLPVSRIDMTFEDSLTLDLGGVTVDVVHIAPGDGVGTAVAHIPSEGVVFSADLYSDHFTVSEFLEDKNFVGTRLILHEMLSWNPVYAINGHSDGNSIEDLKVNAELLDRLYDDVLGRLNAAAESGGMPAMWMAMFAMQYEVPAYEEYSDWENFEAGFPAYVRRMALSILHGG